MLTLDAAIHFYIVAQEWRKDECCKQINLFHDSKILMSSSFSFVSENDEVVEILLAGFQHRLRCSVGGQCWILGPALS